MKVVVLSPCCFRLELKVRAAILLRAKIARCAKLYEIVPGALITFHEKSDNALYIVLSGSVRVEVSAPLTQPSRLIISSVYRGVVEHRSRQLGRMTIYHREATSQWS